MWQPIETAPEDRHFLAWARLQCDVHDEDGRVIEKDKVSHYAVVAYYAFGGIVEYPWRGSIPSNVTFTHWQELPPGPTARCVHCGGEEDDHIANYYCPEFRAGPTVR